MTDRAELIAFLEAEAGTADFAHEREMFAKAADMLRVDGERPAPSPVASDVPAEPVAKAEQPVVTDVSADPATEADKPTTTDTPASAEPATEAEQPATEGTPAEPMAEGEQPVVTA